MSINLTASDRSVIYALLASKKAISAVEENNIKSWWKKILLKFHYNFEVKKLTDNTTKKPTKKQPKGNPKGQPEKSQGG